MDIPFINHPNYQSTNTDIGKVVRQAVERGIDITDGSYAEWMRLGASLVSLGDVGRGYYHALSVFHQKYRSEQTDKMFDNLTRTASIKTPPPHIAFSRARFVISSCPTRLADPCPNKIKRLVIK